MKISVQKKHYTFEYSDGFIRISNRSGQLLYSPLSAQLVLASGVVCQGSGEAFLEDNKVILPYEELPEEIESASLTLQLFDEEIICSFCIKAKNDLAINKLEYFRKANKAIKPNDIEFAFAPAPRGAAGHGTMLYKKPCDASTNGYFAPPPFIMVIGNRFGKIAFSLLDMPNSKQFKFNNYFSVLVEAAGGNIKLKAGEEYHAPRLMLTFPTDEWQAMQDYYIKLKEHGAIDPVPIEDKNLPQWWKRFVVDSYGDQMTQHQYNVYVADDWASADYNTAWLYKWLDTAEERLGTKDFNIVLDAFWQYEWSLDPVPDQERFPDLREFIDEAHRRGHKVLLWIVPFVEDKKLHLSENEPTWAQRYCVLNSVNSVDWTADNVEAYLRDYCHALLSGDDGCLDADGVKLDGAQLTADPIRFRYANPEKGGGVRELMHFYKLFNKIAQSVKPDALINTSVVNPFFENDIHICRLGDQSVRTEREERARISSLMAPNMLMDSDSVVDSRYIKEDYLAACVYSVPYLYNTDMFNLGERPDDATMRALGRLLSLSDKKPYGRAVFVDYGTWQWETRGRITAACFDYDVILVFSEDGTGYVFSWSSGMRELPLFGWKLAEDPDALQLRIDLTAGEIATFRFIP